MTGFEVVLWVAGLCVLYCTASIIDLWMTDKIIRKYGGTD